MLAEQSNVPFVLTRKIVGTPALAITLRGEYPPFAEISMTCVPSMMRAVGTPAFVSSVSGFTDINQNAPPTRSVLTATEMKADVFIFRN